MPDKIPTHRPRSMLVANKRDARAYDATPERRADRSWYSSAPWRKCRAAVLAERPLCEDCLERGELTTATQVHHVVERKERPDLAYDMSNLRSLCASCHSAKSKGKHK